MGKEGGDVCQNRHFTGGVWGEVVLWRGRGCNKDIHRRYLLKERWRSGGDDFEELMDDKKQEVFVGGREERERGERRWFWRRSTRTSREGEEKEERGCG